MSRRSSRYYYEKAGSGPARRTVLLPSISTGDSGCASQVRESLDYWMQREPVAVTSAEGDVPNSYRACSLFATGPSTNYTCTALVNGVLVETGGYDTSGRIEATLGGNKYSVSSVPLLSPMAGSTDGTVTVRSKVTQYLAANPGATIDRWVLFNHQY